MRAQESCFEIKHKIYILCLLANPLDKPHIGMLKNAVAPPNNDCMLKIANNNLDLDYDLNDMCVHINY